MNRLDPNSDKFTELLKAHLFEENFTFQDPSECSEPITVKLVLHNSTLTVLFPIRSKETIQIDKSFSVKFEDLSVYELKVSFQLDQEPYEWKFFAHSLSAFTEWKQAFLVSRRPSFLQSPACFLCKSVFYLFRRRTFCKYCGHNFCSNCIPYRTQLLDLAYTSKQELCKICVQKIRIPGCGVQNSMILQRSKIESRSVLE